jgi:hypothetical protein
LGRAGLRLAAQVFIARIELNRLWLNWLTDELHSNQRRTCAAAAKCIATYTPRGKRETNMLWRGFQKPKRLAVDAETLTDTYGKFSAQPFERGFGTTIGNALRRTLLSSIEGAAVTAVRIEGVLHEFQSITGVVEDATDIILNLKQIPFKLAGEGPKALYLRADQPAWSPAA